MRGRGPRVLTFRYVGALLAVAGLLVAGQVLVQLALERQQGDARVVNIAGRQRMLSQRLCMLMLAIEIDGVDRSRANLSELSRVADEWALGQEALQDGRAETGIRGGNSAVVRDLFVQIEEDHRAMLGAARAALAAGTTQVAPYARIARAHQDAFLAGMDHIVAEYEREARARVAGLSRTELGLLALALVVLGLEGAFVFRPAVRGLRAYLRERDAAQQAVLQVSDREQKRIAQDLHDGLGQHLVGVASLVKSLAKDPAIASHRDRLDEVGRLLADAIDQTRTLARGLYSHTLEVEGLAAALAELATNTERFFGVACRIHDETAGVEPSSPDCVHLHRIAREAVLNAAKHANASAIEIELARNASSWTLVVRDDGVGVRPSPAKGMGLQLMEYRARMMGASLQIAAGELRGTIVTCNLPVAAGAVA